MFNDNTSSDTLDTGPYQYQIATGATVYDAAGEKVGTVAEYDPQAGYMLVEKGWLFHKDIYIPLDAISNTDENGIYLQLYKDDLKQDRFSSPPTIGTGVPAGSYSGADTGYVNTGGSTYVDDTGAAMGTTPRATDATTWDRTGQTVGQTNQAEDIRIPVREEELVVGKEQQEAGRVHVHKDVVEEPTTVDVPLRRERVTVERVAYSGDADVADADAFKETDIDVPVKGERAVVGKRVGGAEEVRIHKDVIDDTQQVSDTVRKERVTIDDQTQQDQR